MVNIFAALLLDLDVRLLRNDGLLRDDDDADTCLGFLLRPRGPTICSLFGLSEIPIRGSSLELLSTSLLRRDCFHHDGLTMKPTSCCDGSVEKVESHGGEVRSF